MKILLQTNVTPIMTVYDSAVEAKPEGAAAPGAGFGDIKRAAMSFVKPVVAVVDESGAVWYKSGDFYNSLYDRFKFVGLALIGYIILRRLL